MHLKPIVETQGTNRSIALKTDQNTWDYIEGVSFGSHCHGGSVASKVNLAKTKGHPQSSFLSRSGMGIRQVPVFLTAL